MCKDGGSQMKEILVSLLAWAAAACVPRAAPLLPPATQRDFVFDRYTPLSSNAEMARRTLPPLTVRRMLEFERQGNVLRQQAVDLTREKFAVYVPAGPVPKDGYGLLVFIAPWSEATRPQLWRAPLDQHRMILVSAANSGNDVKVLDRRLPLALLAWENVRARYPIDPKRVYVGGLSGGSRAAEVAVLAYPDVFRGALLNAGSDPIGGERGIYLPPADLFRRFQGARLVFVTGERDELNLRDDEWTRSSLHDFCAWNVEVHIVPKLGHEPLDPRSFERALAALEQDASPDPVAQEQCEERLRKDVRAKLAEVEAAIARGDRAGARSRLTNVDAHYAGLAGPELLELDARVSALH